MSFLFLKKSLVSKFSALVFFRLHLMTFYFFSHFIYCYLKENYSVDFCHMSTWISHRYTYVPSSLSLPPTSSHPSRLSQSPSLSSPSQTANLHRLFYIWWRVCFHAALSFRLTLSFLAPCPGPTSLFATSVSLLLPCKQIHQYHLSTDDLWNICLSLWLCWVLVWHVRSINSSLTRDGTWATSIGSTES